MAVKIRLKRMGKIRAPYYRIVVADSRTKRDGRAIEEIGKYHPTHEPSVMEVNKERVQYWLSVGAQPTEQVLASLKVTGDWQTFKGYKFTDGTLRVAEPKRDKLEIFNEALKDSANEPKTEAVTKRAAKKSAAKPAEDKADDKADEKAEIPAETPAEVAAEEAVPVPAAETPEGGADVAETAEAAEADAAAKKDEA